MSPLLSAWQIVLKRSLANWRLLSTVLVGIIVAVALLSSAPLFSNAINDLGLIHILENESPELLDLQVYAPNYYVDQEEFDSAVNLIESQVDRTLRTVVRDQETWVKSQTFYMYYTDRPTPEGAFQPKGHFHTFFDMADHITLVDGRMYESTPANLTDEELEADDFAVEGLIGSETAELMQVKVGDVIMFEGGYGDNKNTLKIKLVGIIDPISLDEEYWMLNRDIFYVETTAEEPPVVPIFIDQDTLFNVYQRIFNDGRASFNWFYYVDITKINSTNANSIKNAVDRMEKQLLSNLPRTTIFTNLNGILTQYQGKLMYTQIPLFLIVFQIAAIILYYLVTVSNMLIDREAGEIALFRGRGASTWHIIGIYFMEGLVLSAVGAAIGPFLGAFSFSLLGRTMAFESLTNGGLLPIRYSDSVLILTLSAAALCLLALLIPAIQAARRGVVSQRQAAARPPSKPFWQRYYLDIILLIFGGVLYWELHTRGSLLTMDVFGGLGMDPLLLITPMLLLMAVAIVFLRIFPLIIMAATRLSRVIGNAPFALGLWYMARNPVHYSRLILLLVMAASVGMFSATFLGTLDTSYIERTQYVSGSDIRLTNLNSYHTSKPGLVERYKELDGVDEVGVFLRDNGRVGTMFTETSFNLLAVDPETVKEIAWFREDFADSTLDELMDILAEDIPIDEGIALPAGSQNIGLWVYSDEENLDMTVFARVKDGQGRYFDIELGMAELGNWTYLESPLTLYKTTTQLLPEPMHLSCVWVRTESGYGWRSGLQGISFDDIQTTGTYEGAMVVENFESIAAWQVSPDDLSGSLTGSQSTLGSIKIDHQNVHNGEASGRYSFSARGATKRAIYANIDDRPMTAIISETLTEEANLNLNSQVQIRVPGQYLYMTPVEELSYFPSLDPQEKGFVLVNIDRFLSLRNRQLASATVYPNEVWLKLGDDQQERDAVGKEVSKGVLGAREYYYQDQLLYDLKTDPLAGAGWSGMLTIAFLGVILVSSLGFIVYSYLSAQQRQLDFAILRTLGFSLRQIMGLVCFEQLFIILVGMGLGTFIGGRLSNIMMPFLQLTEQGERVLPPFILSVDWGTVGMAYAFMGLAFIITISLVILFFSRVAIHKTLRMGDL